jgi:hypothetical protein
MPCANLQHVGEHAYVGDPIEDPERRYAWPIIWADRIKTHARRQPSRAGCHSQRHGATAAGTSAAHAPSCLTSYSQCFLALALDRLPHTQRFMQNLCCRIHEPTPLSLSPGREKLGRFFTGLRTRFQSRSSIFGWARGLLQSEPKAVDLDVVAFQPAKPFESLPKCCDPLLPYGVGLQAMHEDADAPDLTGLLSARRGRCNSARVSPSGHT